MFKMEYLKAALGFLENLGNIFIERLILQLDNDFPFLNVYWKWHIMSDCMNAPEMFFKFLDGNMSFSFLGLLREPVLTAF